MPFTKNIVTDYGCPTDGVTDCRSAFLAFKSDAQGLDSFLTVPAHTYNFTANLGPNDNALIFKGIPSLIVDMTGATITDNGGTGGVAFGATGMNFAIHNSPRLATATVGQTSVTCLHLSDASLFTVGTYALLTGYDLQGLWQTGFGAPPNPQFFEYVLITGISGPVISLSAPLKNTYRSDWPNYSQGATDGPDQGGPATLYVLDPTWNLAHEYRGGTVVQTNQTLAIGRSIIYRNMTCITGGGLIPSQNGLIRYIDCNHTQFIEVDKLIDEVSFEGATTLGQIQFQSASTNLLNISGTVSFTTLNGTPKNTTASNATIGTLKLGPNFYGRSDGSTFSNCAISTLLIPGGQLEQGTGAVGVNHSWTMTNGIITIPNTHGALPWAVPGTECVWAGQYDSETSFTIIGVTQDATNSYVQTSLNGSFPTVPLTAGKLFIQVHPCPNANFTNCTGDPVIVDFSNVGAQGKPIFSYSLRSFDATQAGPLANGSAVLETEWWGNLISLKFNVTKPYTGVLGALTLHFGADNYPTIKHDGSVFTYGPVIDLTKTGLRVITLQGVTGIKGLDSSLSVPEAVWLTQATGIGLSGNISGELSTGPQFTIEVITDQGFSSTQSSIGLRTFQDWVKRQKNKIVPSLSESAVELGRLGGHARAKALTSNQRSNISRNAANARWK